MENQKQKTDFQMDEKEKLKQEIRSELLKEMKQKLRAEKCEKEKQEQREKIKNELIEEFKARSIIQENKTLKSENQLYKQNEGDSKFGIGFISGLFLSLLGLIIVFNYKENSHERETAMKGWVAGFVISIILIIINFLIFCLLFCPSIFYPNYY